VSDSLSLSYSFYIPTSLKSDRHRLKFCSLVLVGALRFLRVSFFHWRVILPKSKCFPYTRTTRSSPSRPQTYPVPEDSFWVGRAYYHQGHLHFLWSNLQNSAVTSCGPQIDRYLFFWSSNKWNMRMMLW
jgi:hypothetical protein